MKSYRFVKEVTEQEVWSTRSGRGKGRLSKQIMDFLKEGLPNFIDQQTVASHFAPRFKSSTIRVALSVLQGMGAVETRGSNKDTLDVSKLEEYQSVRTWLNELKEGQGHKSGIYAFKHFWDYVIARPSNKFGSPDDLINDALDGTQRNLLSHLGLIKEYLRTAQFENVDEETARRHYASIRGFYKRNGVPASRIQAETLV